MRTGDKIAALRKENHYTQEQLAELLGVSRQAVGKWESGLTYPETEKLIRMSELFGCSLDYLLKDSVDAAPGPAVPVRQPFRARKSEKIICGLPLWHIGRNASGIIAVGLNARGWIAVGLNARGILSFGLLSVGVVSFGMASLGLLSLGLLAVGLLSAGCFSIGAMAAGAISLGLVSLGAVSVGEFSVGALAVGHYAALGDHAKAMIALGDTKATGDLFQATGDLTARQLNAIKDLLDSTVPSWLQWASKLFQAFL